MAKILINIPDGDLDFIRDMFADGELPDSISLTATIMYAIANGKILDKATNGDIIKAFYSSGDEIVLVEDYSSGDIGFDKEWWNAPYKGGN